MKKTLFILAVVFSFCAHSQENFQIMIEGGAAWQTRNDIKIPSNSGSTVAADQIDNGPFAHYRIEAFYRFKKHHSLRAVYAPFEIDVTQRPTGAVNFNNVAFNANEDLKINYQFNSYRLTYLYGLFGFDKDQLNIGLTLKVRDADIKFSQGALSTNYDNVGLVPLFSFEYQKSLGANWSTNFFVDAAAASQGRAIDAALKLRYHLGELGKVGFGLRTLEGGADNDKVKTFSWFHYAVVDYVLSF